MSKPYDSDKISSDCARQFLSHAKCHRRFPWKCQNSNSNDFWVCISPCKTQVHWRLAHAPNPSGAETWTLFPIRRLIVRFRKVLKPWDLYLELYDRSGNWQAHWQQCCRCACQISKWCDNLKYQSRDLETSRDLTMRRLIGYWNRAQNIPG